MHNLEMRNKLLLTDDQYAFLLDDFDFDFGFDLDFDFDFGFDLDLDFDFGFDLDFGLEAPFDLDLGFDGLELQPPDFELALLGLALAVFGFVTLSRLNKVESSECDIPSVDVYVFVEDAMVFSAVGIGLVKQYGIKKISCILVQEDYLFYTRFS